MTDITIFSIICILIIGICSFVYTKVRQKKNNISIDRDAFLKDFTESVISIAQSTLKILAENKNEYKSEQEFKDRLIYLVATELREQLLETDVLPIAKFIPEDQYISFVGSVFNIYEKQINITEIFNGDAKKKLKDTKKEKPKLKEPEKNQKVDITKELTKTIMKE